MNYSIRAAREEDAGPIIELLNPIIEAGIYTVMEEPLSLEEQIEYMRAFPVRGVFNVAVCDDSRKLLGLQSVEPMSAGAKAFRHVGEISTFVSLDVHGQGIGRALSEATFRDAKAQGFMKISAMIRGDNPRAVGFYLEIGFRVIGTAQRHALVGERYIDEVLAEMFICD